VEIKWLVVVVAIVSVLTLIVSVSALHNVKVTGEGILDVFKKEKTASSTTETNSGKPSNVISWSNGFPSGEHFNLNIHGKKDGFICDSSSGGSSVFVSEYGQSEIQLIQNKKSSVDYLNVIDKCSFSESDPAKVQLPSGEYQVYARILAKPSNPKKNEERKVIFYPKLIDACNDDSNSPIDGFGDYIDCSNESLVGLGVITSGGVFDKESQELIRISPVKGKNQATEITEMFQWSGYACNEIYDLNGDGQITLDDVSVDYDENGIIDSADLTLYLELSCSYYDSEWVFNIADLVVYGWDYYNSGSKLVQVRFYPLQTTTFE